MTQPMDKTRSRGGWSEEEAKTLFERVSRADEERLSLRAVFEDVGRELGRKPNSIRNFYYAKVHESPALAGDKQKAFRVFTQEETRELVAAVLAARGRGASVRACVRELAMGDPKQMLRFQNKYRAVLRSKPELMTEIASELCQKGVSVPDITQQGRQADRQESELDSALSRYESRVGSPAARTLVKAVTTLIDAAAGGGELLALLEKSREQTAKAKAECDRLRVQADLLKLELEDARKESTR